MIGWNENLRTLGPPWHVIGHRWFRETGFSEDERSIRRGAQTEKVRVEVWWVYLKKAYAYVQWTEASLELWGSLKWNLSYVQEAVIGGILQN